MELVQFLLSQPGIDVNVKEVDSMGGFTPLHLAIKLGNLEVNIFMGSFKSGDGSEFDIFGGSDSYLGLEGIHGPAYCGQRRSNGDREASLIQR